MEQIIKDFGVQPILLAAQIVNFFILLFLLRKFLYGPLLKVLEERKKRIAKSLKDAEQIEQQLAKIESEREESLAQSAKETKKALEEAQKVAAQIINEAHSKAQSDIEEMITKSQQSLALEREKLHQEIRQDLANLVVIGLQKVTGKVLTTKDQKTIVTQTLKELED